MPKKITSIPVNPMANESGAGISIDKISIKGLQAVDKSIVDIFANAEPSHRHDAHSFFLLENGTVFVEIDFQRYIIEPPSVIYVHPDQVHRTLAFENVIVSSWAITNESLNPDYLKLLEDLTPAKPLLLTKEAFSLMSETVTLCLQFSERKNDKLYFPLLKDGCNALVALVVSQYMAQSKPADKHARFDQVTKSFRELLEQHYTTTKRPAAYAQKLNISTPYLNECVKNATGYSVSYHIQQRIILEAKRLLYYSDKAVKEIAVELGYDDYPYFSRLFTKLTGTTAIAFRHKNRD